MAGASCRPLDRSLFRAAAYANQAIESLIDLIGRARTDLLAGFAANVIACLVKGLIPSRAFVAGFLTTRNFAKPGIVKTPFFLSSRYAICERLSRTSLTCLRVTPSETSA